MHKLYHLLEAQIVECSECVKRCAGEEQEHWVQQDESTDGEERIVYTAHESTAYGWRLLQHTYQVTPWWQPKEMPLSSSLIAQQ